MKNRQSMDANTKRTKTSEICNKDFKVAVTKMLECPILDTLETNEKTENLSQERENVKMSQTKISKSNNTVTNFSDLMYRLNS